MIASWPEAAKEKDCEGDTPLHVALRETDGTPEAVVMALLAAWPDAAKEKNDGGFTPLDLALANNAPAAVAMALIAACPDAVKEIGKYGTKLHIALENHAPDAVTMALIAAWPDAVKDKFDDWNEDGIPLLHAVEHEASGALVLALVAAWPEGVKELRGYDDGDEEDVYCNIFHILARRNGDEEDVYRIIHRDRLCQNAGISESVLSALLELHDFPYNDLVWSVEEKSYVFATPENIALQTKRCAPESVLSALLAVWPVKTRMHAGPPPGMSSRALMAAPRLSRVSSRECRPQFLSAIAMLTSTVLMTSYVQQARGGSADEQRRRNTAACRGKIQSARGSGDGTACCLARRSQGGGR